MTFDELLVVQAAAARLRGTAKGFSDACSNENPTGWFGRCCHLVIGTLNSEAAALEEVIAYHEARYARTNGGS